MILAVVVAWIAATGIIMVCQMFMGSVWAPPTQTVRSDPESMRAYIQALPTQAFVVLALIYAVASFAGGFIVTKMGRRWSPGITLSLIIGFLLLIGGVLNFFVVLPYHPTWVTALCLAIYLPFTLLGHKVAK